MPVLHLQLVQFLGVRSVCVMAVGNTASADIFGSGVNQFTIDFVPISGDASSANGTYIGNNKPEGFADPANNYRMGTYEISNAQWTKFKAIYGAVTGNEPFAYDSDPTYWTGDNLATQFVSWLEAAQFVNYLNTSTGHQAAYKFTGTQHTSNYTLGVWQSGDVGYNASNPYRNSNAYYFLPTENEWVKAAYWNGTGLQTYATKAGQTLFQGNGMNGGWNYYYNHQFATNPYGPWDVTSGSQELNGTYNMMGNVWEWMESPYSAGSYLSVSSRGVRGGSFYHGDGLDQGDAGALASSFRSYCDPRSEYGTHGFRVASVSVSFTLSASVVNGHGQVSPTGGTYNQGTVVSFTATPDQGYRVKAWSGTDNVPAAGTNTNTVTMNSDKVVTVEFEPIPTYTLSASVVNGHGQVSPTNGTYNEGTVVNLTATPDQCYRVKAWSGADNVPVAGTNTNTVTMNSDKTVTVEFELIPLPSVVAGPIINPANGHSYYLLRQSTWMDAEAKAIEMGGHLVTINDQTENDWVYNTFLPLAGASGEKSQCDLWIGYTDVANEGVWEWVGEHSDFVNWTSIKPDGGTAENYGMIWGIYWQTNGFPLDIPGQWNDLPNSDISDRGISPRGVVEIIIEPPIAVTVGIHPNTLNLRSEGNWITGVIAFPADINVTDVNCNSILLNGQITADSTEIDEHKNIVVAKFSRTAVGAILQEGTVELTISGQLINGK
jgi:formylglycine-generating enzyme required for sulfatase activity